MKRLQTVRVVHMLAAFCVVHEVTWCLKYLMESTAYSFHAVWEVENNTREGELWIWHICVLTAINLCVSCISQYHRYYPNITRDAPKMRPPKIFVRKCPQSAFSVFSQNTFITKTTRLKQDVVITQAKQQEAIGMQRATALQYPTSKPLHCHLIHS